MSLRGVFTIFSGIGEDTARRCREAGCRDWQDLLRSRRRPGMIPSDLAEQIAEAEAKYAARDAAYFHGRLPNRLRYLVCLEFPEKVTFLGIETTGPSRTYHHITLAGWARDGVYRYELLGRGRRTSAQLTEDLAGAPVAVTFSGRSHILPALRTVADLPPVCPVDLRLLAFRLGHAGSQSSVQRQLGLDGLGPCAQTRRDDAPGLWFRATRGDVEALCRLIEHNYLGIRGMAKLLAVLAPAARLADAVSAPVDRRPGPRPQLPRPPEPPQQPGPPRRPQQPGLPRLPRRPQLTRRILRAAVARIAPEARPLLTARPGVTGDQPVVGIDLTASERRASGMAALIGEHIDAVTAMTDEDILRFVRQNHPRVVSIDAPLSLPSGRSRVGDDDPARKSAGILRGCERELLRRGVNVYPCLLPSMQNLTARGIRLADVLRQEGFPTIECYPGGAQDILAMPRKGVGVQFLQRALADAGWGLPPRVLNHDELDAVTAAIVGAFFLEDRFEAVGTAEEGRIIVPALQPPERAVETVVAFSGAICAGKTMASRWLERHVHLAASENTRRSRCVAGTGAPDAFDAAHHPAEREAELLESLADEVVANETTRPADLFAALAPIRVGLRA